MKKTPASSQSELTLPASLEFGRRLFAACLSDIERGIVGPEVVPDEPQTRTSSPKVATLPESHPRPRTELPGEDDWRMRQLPRSDR